MVSQRSKLNLIMVVGLCIVNIKWITSEIFPLNMTFDGRGNVSIDFFKINFTLNYKELNLTIQDVACTYWVAFGTKLTEKELQEKSGQRKGYIDCKSWHPPSGQSYYRL
uniref:Uncharacterized protein n=1 Tax=Trichobilharzia regenti TaxID=157069 RepID=A0AA85KK96_TRIRE|nr:unnamed protein product [Trichobilharzia regenti]